MTRGSNRRAYPTPPTTDGFAKAQVLFAQSFESLFGGRINSVNDFTLTAGTSTVITSPFFHGSSVLIFMPKSAAAAALHPSMWVVPGLRTATINHATAVGGEAFSWAALG